VLQRLLQVLRATADGTRAGVDIEFLHDYRVAVRRTRSALRHAKSVLPEELLACFRPEFGWLQEATGPVRDLDVYLEELTADRAALGPDRAADLDAVADVLHARRDAAQHVLSDDLGSPRAAALLADWDETLLALSADKPEEGEEAGEWGEWPRAAADPVADVVAARIVRQYRKLVDDGRRIRPHSPAEDLHDLRKSGKELRYLFELFGSALPTETVSAIVKDLKGLQDCLGRFQDTQIQQSLLTELSLELVAEDRATHGALLGIGGLVDRLEQRRAAARAEFADRFAAFAAAPVRKRIGALRSRPEGDQ
jgi:CHAD domain-containing protein